MTFGHSIQRTEIARLVQECSPPPSSIVQSLRVAGFNSPKGNDSDAKIEALLPCRRYPNLTRQTRTIGGSWTARHPTPVRPTRRSGGTCSANWARSSRVGGMLVIMRIQRRRWFYCFLMRCHAQGGTGFLSRHKPARFALAPTSANA